MGATESVLYNEEEEDLKNTGSQQQLSHRRRSIPRRSNETQQAMEGGGGKSKRVIRPRAPGAAGKDLLPLRTLQGLVVGPPASGKKTLLERLQGKDPFARKIIHNGNDGETLRERRRRRSETNLAPVVVSYQVPARAAVWDRLQLKMQIFSDQHQPVEGAVDFTVILLDPRDQTLEQIQAFLVEVIPDLLNKSCGQTTPGQNRTETNGEKQTGHPFLCLCFLINFRDQVPPVNHEDQNDDTTAMEEQVKECVTGIVQQYTSDRNQDLAVLLDHLLLEFATTSLKNCYGLTVLHQFIYKAYLLSKQWDLQGQLFQVQQQLLSSGSSSLEPPRLKYADFLKMVEEEEWNNRANDNARKHGESNRGPQQQRGKHRDVNSHPNNNASNSRSHHQQQLTEDTTTTQERIDLKEKQPSLDDKPLPLNCQQTQDTLEAFLASEDEESSVAMRQSEFRNAAVLSSSDDDDDDLFYDERGWRHAQTGTDSPSLSIPTSRATTTKTRSSETTAKSKAGPHHADPVESRETGSKTEFVSDVDEQTQDAKSDIMEGESSTTSKATKPETVRAVSAEEESTDEREYQKVDGPLLGDSENHESENKTKRQDGTDQKSRDKSETHGGESELGAKIQGALASNSDDSTRKETATSAVDDGRGCAHTSDVNTQKEAVVDARDKPTVAASNGVRQTELHGGPGDGSIDDGECFDDESEGADDEPNVAALRGKDNFNKHVKENDRSGDEGDTNDEEVTSEKWDSNSHRPNAVVVKLHKANSDDDDDEFFIGITEAEAHLEGNTSDSMERPQWNAHESQMKSANGSISNLVSSKPNEFGTHTGEQAPATPAKKPALAGAIQAAINAAQKEAALMLERENPPENNLQSKKDRKKNKKKKHKKKKDT